MKISVYESLADMANGVSSLILNGATPLESLVGGWCFSVTEHGEQVSFMLPKEAYFTIEVDE